MIAAFLFLNLFAARFFIAAIKVAYRMAASPFGNVDVEEEGCAALRVYFSTAAGSALSSSLPSSSPSARSSSFLCTARVAVREVEGAGAGLFALEDFHVGELVLEESPFACVPAHGNEGIESESELQRIVEGLDSDAKRAFYSLADKNMANVRGACRKSTEKTIEASSIQTVSLWVMLLLRSAKRRAGSSHPTLGCMQ